PTNPVRAATAIRDGGVRPIYLGQIDPASKASESRGGVGSHASHGMEEGATRAPTIDHRLFILMVGAGFDASIVRNVPPGKKRLGMLAYMVAGIIQLFRYDYSTVTFRVDGREVKGTSGIIAKARCYGGPFAIVPHVRLEDPELVLCLFKGRGPITYMKYTLGVITGLHSRMKDVEFHSGRKIEIESTVPLQADGESIGCGPARLTIVPQTLNLVYPAMPQA
ncbi:MAG TPA: hypothetical protein VFH55_06820, partial [Nitrospiria bacterium]|nr:hypothetical protein [Nitrospiria bacterium]